MAKSTILGPNGEPIDYGVLTQEIAEPGLTSIRQVYPDTVASGMTPERMVAILDAAAKNSTRDFLTLAEEMEERDTHYFSVLGTRKLAVQGLPVTIEAASEDPADVKIADAVRDLFATDVVQDCQADLLDALGKGFSVSEIVWDTSESQWMPKQITHRDPRWFRFDWIDRTTIRLLDEKDPAFGLPLQPFKFIRHVPKLKTGIPIRGGLARMIAYMWIISAYALKDWMAFAEVFGMPLRVGRYPATATPKDVAILKRAVANIGTDAAAVLPESMKIEFVEAASGAGGTDLYERLCQYMDKQKSKAVLGQTMTTDEGSSRAQGQVHDKVRGDILTSDGMQLESSFNRDLVKPFVDLNFGPQKKYPKARLREADEDDIAQLTTSVAALVPLGLRVGQKVMREKLGLPEPEPQDELLAQPAPPPSPFGPPGADAADPADRAMNRAGPQLRGARQAQQDQIELTAGAQKLADPALLQGRLDAIRALLEDSGDLRGFADGLTQLAASSDQDAFVEAMTRAGFAAQLAGRSPRG
jgi:phage gp29-like protein